MQTSQWKHWIRCSGRPWRRRYASINTIQATKDPIRKWQLWDSLCGQESVCSWPDAVSGNRRYLLAYDRWWNDLSQACLLFLSTLPFLHKKVFIFSFGCYPYASDSRYLSSVLTGYFTPEPHNLNQTSYRKSMPLELMSSSASHFCTWLLLFSGFHESNREATDGFLLYRSHQTFWCHTVSSQWN